MLVRRLTWRWGIDMIYGAGVCDIGPATVNGRKTKSYSAWQGVMQRCFDNKWRSRYPTYSNCTVSDEWLYFSNFKKWFDIFYVDGYVIDKDLIFPGNKLYSKHTCVLIPQHINKFISMDRVNRGNTRVGCWYDEQTKKYRAYICEKGRQKSIGYFKTEAEASSAWVERKIIMANEMKDECDLIHPMLFNGIMRSILEVR